MAGQLIQVATETVTSAVASVTLTGIDSDDVYMLAVSNAELDSATQQSLAIRVTVSGTADDTANYDSSAKNMTSSTSFVNEGVTNRTSFQFGNQLRSTTTQSQSNAILYLFNFNNASEYSFGTNETVDFRYTSELWGRAGGFVHTVAQACDGVNIFCVSGANIDKGTFTLYKVI